MAVAGKKQGIHAPFVGILLSIIALGEPYRHNDYTEMLKTR